jgi:hypothetical protein
MTSFIALLLSILGIMGASSVIGYGWMHINRSHSHDPWTRLLFGFIGLPIIIAYGGFLKIFSVPFVINIVYIISILWSLRMIFVMRKRIPSLLSNIAAHWRYWLFPAAIILFVAAAKFWYLFGGMSGNSDDIRSIMLVSSFATNHLKPAFPLDFSLPVVYPYYLFLSAAFAYAGLQGWMFPGIPLLAVTLLALVWIYRCLWLALQSIHPSAGPLSFLITCCSFTFAGFRLSHTFPDALLSSPAPSISQFFHTGYHYLFGAAIGILGLIFLYECLYRNNQKRWMTASLLLATSFGFGGIVGVWVLITAIMLTAYGLWPAIKTTGWSRTSRGLCTMIVTGLIVLLPQIFSSLPRLAPTFTIRIPGLFFSRDIAALSLELHKSLNIIDKILFDGLVLLMTTGFLALLGTGISFVLVLRQKFSSGTRWSSFAEFPLLCILFTSLLLLIITEAPSGDWTGRGLIVPIAAASILAGSLKISARLKKGALMLFILLTLIQGTLWTQEFAAGFSTRPTTTLVNDIREKFPFGTQFYIPDWNENNTAVFEAGRSVIGMPEPGFLAFMNDLQVLHALHIITEDNKAFDPCRTSWFGKSLTGKTFTAIKEDTYYTDIPCDTKNP